VRAPLTDTYALVSSPDGRGPLCLRRLRGSALGPRSVMKRSLHRQPRGQNLLLLALTMLFIALMVTVTLGVGDRIRENHELQNVADAAAWSNAVMTARAYNDAALVNRLVVSMWVAQAADQSLISWTSYASSLVPAAQQAAQHAECAVLCPDKRDRWVPCNRDEVQDAVAAMGQIPEGNFLRTSPYPQMDEAAGLEAFAIQTTIMRLEKELRSPQDPNSLRARLYDELQAQRLTERVIAQAGVPGVRPVQSSNPALGPGGVSRRETDCDGPAVVDEGYLLTDPAGSGLCVRYSWSRTMLEAAMGSRGNPFVTLRGVMPRNQYQRLQDLAGRLGYLKVSATAPTGSGYWANGLMHGTNPTTTESWADDHGDIRVEVKDRGGMCTKSASEPMAAHVRSNAKEITTDEHLVIPPDNLEPRAELYHTMGACQPMCPTVWVRSLGWQPAEGADDVWGQPKLPVAVERDNAAVRSPWELHFSFPFSATGPAREWDGRGETLHTGVADQLDVRRPVAVSTGMAYYHRGGHWEEMPNLLNPFWHATLVPADIDAQGDVLHGGGDPGAILPGSRQHWQRDAWDRLARAGYKGLY